MSNAPIALFAYNRLTHLRQTVEALAENDRATQSDLFVFSDGPRNPGVAEAVQQVRDWLPSIRGFKSVSVVMRPQNLGLASSIISGVTELVNRYGRVIVLEDDMVTSKYFLQYMNDALELYEGEEQVVSVHGYVYPVSTKLPDTFFLRGADCWGWATWRRGWNLFERDGRKLLKELEARALCRDFDFEGTAHYTNMLRMQIEGRNDSWAVRWYAAAFLAGKLTLYPGRSLVYNIGNDGSGQHCGVTDIYRSQVASAPVRVGTARLQEDGAARAAFVQYFSRSAGWRGRLASLVGRVRQFLS